MHGPSRVRVLFGIARRWCVGGLAAAITLASAGIAPAGAQDSAVVPPAISAGSGAESQGRGPLFFTDTAADGHWVDAHDAPVLQHRVSITLIGVPLGSALEAIAHQAGASLSYTPELLPLGARVSVNADDTTLAAVLSLLLTNAGQDVLVRAGGDLTLVSHDVVAHAADSSRVVTGSIVDVATNGPVPYATVALVGTEHARFADGSGHFRLARLSPRSYVLRARQIGYAPVDTTVAIGQGPTVVTVTLRMRRIPAVLSAVRIAGRRGRGCVATGIPDAKADPTLAAIFEQLRENVDRTRLLSDQYPFRYTREEQRIIRRSPGGDSTDYIDSLAFDSRARRPYRVGDVTFYHLDTVFHRAGPGDAPHSVLRRHMYLPVFSDLADSTFLAAHCFTLGAIDRDRNGPTMFRIDFDPASRIATPDVEGSIYIDARELLVRRAFFTLTKPEAAKPPVISFSVMTTFRPIIPLVPLVDSMGSQQLVGTTAGHVDPARALSRFALTTDRMISVSFDSGAPDAHVSPAPAGPAPARPTDTTSVPSDASGGTRVRAFFPPDPSCKVQPPADTIASMVYATLRAARPVRMRSGAWSHYASRVLSALRRSFVLPTDLTLETFSGPFQISMAQGVSRGGRGITEAPKASSGGSAQSDSVRDAARRRALYVAPTLSTTVRLRLAADGAMEDARVVVASGSVAVDTLMLAAIRRAATHRDFPTTDSTDDGPGAVTVDIGVSMDPPSAGDTVSLGRVEEPAWRWEREAALDARLRQPNILGDLTAGDPAADTANFEFVVDARGRALPSTAHPIHTGSKGPRSGRQSALETRVLQLLSGFYFTPAVVASCPVSQVITQAFGYAIRPAGDFSPHSGPK